MGRVSGMEISSSQGLKKPPKLAQGKKLFPPKGRRPAGGKLGLIFGGFFNPWDSEISIPETRPIQKSHICVPGHG